MDDESNATHDLRESRKILKPYRHLFSKPITVKRNEHSRSLFGIDDRNVSNSCTQTSKTILELATLDSKPVCCRDRSISPDSLCASPRKAAVFTTESRPVSEAETIELDKKECNYALLRKNSTKEQRYVHLEDNHLSPPLDQYYDDFDEYTPEGSVHASENFSAVLRTTTSQQQHTQNPMLYTTNSHVQNHRMPLNVTPQPHPNYNNMVSNAKMTAPYPPLYEQEIIVANAHMNNFQHQMKQVAIAHACHANAAFAQQQRVNVPTMLPDPNATATVSLTQQQQLEKLVDTFPNNSLVDTFLAKSKNRFRYGGNQSDCRSKPIDECVKQNSLRFKSLSYIEPTMGGAISPHHQLEQPQQHYPNRSKFTMNNCHLNQHQYHCSHGEFPSPPNDAHLPDPPIHYDRHNSSTANQQQPMYMEGDIYSNYVQLKNNVSSKTAFGQRRSNSFMMPTIASERRSCMQEVRQIKRLLSPTMRGCTLSPRNNQSAGQLCNNSLQSGIAGPQQEQQYQQPDLQRQQYYQYQQQHQQMPDTRKTVPQTLHKIKVPYIDGSVCDDDTVSDQRNKVYKEKIKDYSPVQIRPVTPRNSFEEDLLKIDQLSLDVKNSSEGNSTGRSNSGTSIDSTINNVLTRIKDDDWNVSLKGLAEVTELCRTTDASVMSPHMTSVNQRLLALLRSPRSHVCRTACQAAGHLFESMKDTRKPEFEDIVNILLYKTADSNKFIRQDANLALDCMVTHISSFHAIKALCGKGPAHKNPLVRCATIRLIICTVVIAGPDNILNPANSDYTRRRVFVHLAKFITDKNLETRKYAERLFKVLSRERSFDMYVKKFLEKEDLEVFKQQVKYLKK